MRHALKKVVPPAAVALCALMSSCGVNPFGAGESSLNVFAYLGKAISKPAAINSDQTGKQGSKATVADAQGMAKRLAKGTLSSVVAKPFWLDSNGIVDSSGVYTYWEAVSNKPSDEDPQKLQTGRAQVEFEYNGDPTVGTFDTAKITAILSFEMIGREHKIWNRATDSIYAKIKFSNPVAKDMKPGEITAWSRNISDLQSLGAGDTASFALNSLDDVKHTQYGAGHFFDAHTGRFHNGDASHFDFTMELIHKNSVDTTKPYERYQDNEGIIYFYLPWQNADSLYFTIHFFPHYDRTGTIQKNGPNGPVLVNFNYNEKSGIGSATYYNSKGEVIQSEDL